MDWIVFASFLWLLSYLVWTLWLRWDFLMISQEKDPQQEAIILKGVSVVIPIRNEAENIESLIASIQKQSYPTDLIEFIFVDDHSLDDSFLMLQKAFFTHKNVFLYALPKNQQGKKSALHLGIQKSRFEYILTTDADCIHQEKWAESMMYEHLQNQVVFTSGLVKYPSPKNVLESFIYYESTWLNSISVLLYAKKHPILASGANLLFSKKAFYEVGGYEKHTSIPSGDDIFLLHDLKKFFSPEKIQVIDCPMSWVLTKYPQNVNIFLHQRIRWAQKTKYYKDKDSIVIGAFIAIMSLVYTLLSIILLFYNWFILIVFLFTKYWLDFLLNKEKEIFSFYQVLGSLLYPVYSFLIVIVSYGVKPVWRDR